MLLLLLLLQVLVGSRLVNLSRILPVAMLVVRVLMLPLIGLIRSRMVWRQIVLLLLLCLMVMVVVINRSL